MTPAEFVQKQSLPYEQKVIHAIARAREFYDHMDGNVFCSVGGLDSITLLLFLRKYVDPNIKGVSISSIEDKRNQIVHRQIGNMVFLKPYKSKVQVLDEFGFPIISKEKARKIEYLQTPENPKQTFIRAIMTGDMGAQGHYGHSEKLKLPDKWIQLFGGLYAKYRPDLECRCAGYKVSDRCCYWMKEKPADDFAKQTGCVPYLGLMASEGGQREKGLMKNGCNYYGKTVTRSCPFAIFSRTDLLCLAMDLKVPVPASYGRIERQADGTLETTLAKRTGCPMCGFGIHIEARPHRFDRMYMESPKEWFFWMLRKGWGKALDHIGVEWRPVKAPDPDEYRGLISPEDEKLLLYGKADSLEWLKREQECAGQISMF